MTIDIGSQTDRCIAQPYRVGFLLIDNFTLIALATAVEPLRVANQMAGTELYSWKLLTADGGYARASDGITMVPDAGIREEHSFDLVIVVAGINVTRSFSRHEIQWLKQMARRHIVMGAVCTGAYVLASAGLLDGYACSAHWECLEAMQEDFPRVQTNNHLFTVDRERMTCTGGTVPMHMMLSFLGRRHGQELSNAISHMFVCDRIREDREQQPMPMHPGLAKAQPKLAEAAQLMEANIEEPIELQELAMLAGISRRQLERLFLKHMGCTPSRYYLRVRLNRARRLLKQTSCSIVEIASLCGFISATHFSRCYRKTMGRAPKYERMEALAPTDAEGLLKDPAASLPSASLQALKRSRTEPTYGTFEDYPGRTVSG
ncbi:Transcriptional regulator GlxA family, contains an amidase domain and an AraC-type DNA-binding HTH domain [Marinobacter sp. es.048]|uniref:choline metabolism transcriptional regulator GbdR n=1 Tax=Marinobacter sp. es.048 TaxID=1761795 RepID=UPI000B592357|nr:GlxA family transcriptional regulator [Marinobacter sp. es.048]SNC65903.1 Transcriptional regulator GlxA family, contains an amidase domain and an AraC-type DNA-binding HTH domain [Marinobacter sp. es.048]